MIILFDTETTGLLLHPDCDVTLQPRIIEFAAIVIDPATGNTVDELEFLVDPKVAISSEITKITGITEDMIKGKPEFSSMLPDVAAIFKGCNTVIAHNLPFDKRMIFNESARIGENFSLFWPRDEVCTVALHAWQYGYDIKMKDLYEQVTGRPLEQTHRALEDVKALAEIVIQMGIHKK